MTVRELIAALNEAVIAGIDPEAGVWVYANDRLGNFAGTWAAKAGMDLDGDFVVTSDEGWEASAQRPFLS